MRLFQKKYENFRQGLPKQNDKFGLVKELVKFKLRLHLNKKSEGWIYFKTINVFGPYKF